MKMLTKSTAPQWEITDPNDYLLWLSWRWKELVHNRRKLSKGCLSLHCITVTHIRISNWRVRTLYPNSSNVFENTGSRIHFFKNSFASSIVLSEGVFNGVYIHTTSLSIVTSELIQTYWTVCLYSRILSTLRQTDPAPLFHVEDSKLSIVRMLFWYFLVCTSKHICLRITSCSKI